MATVPEPTAPAKAIRLTRPCVGFCGLVINDHEINGISYINPWLLEDIADLFDDVADRVHSASMMLDCEGMGLAALTVIESETISVVRDDNLIIYEDMDDMPGAIRLLADSIGENVPDWAEWADHEDETPEEAIRRIDDVIHRLYMASERLAMGRPSDPADALRLWAQVRPSDITASDANLLTAEMQAMCARTNALPKSPLQRTWYVSSNELRSRHDSDNMSSIRINASSHYFENRQLVFLRDDGTIEVAGWCDSTNLRPVMDAFVKWCIAVRKLHAEVKGSQLDFA